MPFDGAGNFKRAYNWVSDAANAALDYITPSRMDADANDLAAGLSNCVTRDGQGTPTADIPWGGRKITSLAAGAAPTDAANVGQVKGTTFLQSTGYEIRTSGIVEQWGIFTVSGDGTVPFATLFPSYCAAVHVQPVAAPAPNAVVDANVANINPGSFDVHVRLTQGGVTGPLSGPTQFFFRAIGF